VLARYQEEIQAETAPSGWLGWKPSWIPWFNKRAVQVTFALVLLLSLLVGGNGVVMAAQDSLPGDRLYPIKTALEKVNLAISLDETQEAQLQVEYTKRRVDELNRLVLEGRNSDVNEAVDNLESQVGQTVEALGSAADQNADQTKVIASQFAVLMRNQNQMLEGLSSLADDSTLSDLQRAKTVSESGATATRQLLQTLPSPTPTARPTRRKVASSDSEPATTVPTKIPVPTKTLRPLSTNPPKATPTAAPIFLPPFEEPSATNTPRPAPTVTYTPRPLPTNTYTPTEKPPTEAPVPTDPPTSTPTSIPTNTPVPTDTPTPMPTDTPMPTPTSMPVPQTTDTVTPALNQPTPTTSRR
jgi:hypothetical protein